MPSNGQRMSCSEPEVARKSPSAVQLERAHARRITRHAHVLAIRQPPAMKHRLLHAGDQKFSIRADRDAEMRALPFKPLRLGAGGIGKPECRAIVMRDRETKALRRKARAGHGRRRLEVATFAFLGEHMRGLARRPRDRAIRAKRDLVDPAFFVVGSEHAMLAVRACFDELAVIAAGDDARSIGGACQNCAGVNRYAAFVVAGEQQCFLAKHEHRRRTEEMHADDGRARVYRRAPIGKRGNRGLRVAHVRRCSFQSLGGFYLRADCGR